jgi:RNA polymerase sigma-70 factor, ECF subfamily
VQEGTDAELVARVLAGEVDAYGLLVRRYQDAYVRFATRMLGSPDDADDALQSAFVRAFRKLKECRDPARFGAWLYQIVLNECRTLAYRRDRRERRMVRDEHDLDSVASEQSAPITRSIGGGLGGLAGLEEIQKALSQIDADQREAFILKYVEELSYDEMAELTGAGVSALKMRVKRACDRLRQMLDPSRSVP